MNIVKKIFFKRKKKKLYQELLDDLGLLCKYLNVHSIPNYQEVEEFYDKWTAFSKKYITDSENGLLYEILDMISKQECEVLLAYIIALLNNWNDFVINHNKGLIEVIEGLRKTRVKQETRIQTKEYALNTINIQKAITKSLQRLTDIIEKMIILKIK